MAICEFRGEWNCRRSNLCKSENAEVIKPMLKVTFLTASNEMNKIISKIELNLISRRISLALIYSRDRIVCDEKYVKTAIEISNKGTIFVLTSLESATKGQLSL